MLTWIIAAVVLFAWLESWMYWRQLRSCSSMTAVMSV
jgi:hypothetical protein